MRNPAVNANIADAVEQFSLLAFATPGAQKFSYPVALFSLLYSSIVIVKKLFNQRAVSRKLLRTKISKSQITNQISRRGTLCERGYLLCLQRINELSGLVRLLLFPVAE